MVTFEAPATRYDLLWSVGVGAAVDPVTSRLGSPFIASIVVTEVATNRLSLHRRC